MAARSDSQDKDKAKGGGLDADLPAPRAVVRFRVSGEPFDVALALLQRHPDSMLSRAALTEVGRAAAGKGGDGIAEVPLDGDVKPFRIALHYIETGEVIVPADPVERRLVAARFGYYNLPDALRQIMLPTARPAFMAAGIHEQGAGAAAAAAAAVGPKEPPAPEDQKHKAPPPEAAARPKDDPQFELYRIRAREDTGAAVSSYWTPARETEIPDEDAAVRARELVARMAFGRGEDGSAGVELVPLLGKDSPGAHPLLGSPQDCPLQNLRFPGIPRESSARTMPLVGSLGEFEYQFWALTGGLLGDALRELPLVVAGGAVLTALHRLPREKSAKVFEGRKMFANITTRPAPNEGHLCAGYVRAYRWSGREDQKGGEVAKIGKGEYEAAADHLGIDRLALLLYLSGRRMAPEEDETSYGKEIPKHVPRPVSRERAGDLWYPSGRIVARLGGEKGVHSWDRGAAYTYSTDKHPENLRHRNYVGGAWVETEWRRPYWSFRHTDVDLFLVTRSPEVARSTLARLEKQIRDELCARHRPDAPPSEKELYIVRTENSVTFVPPRPYRQIQVILRLYASAAQVLLGFDLDCCCVAYDGRGVISTGRGLRALRTRRNLVDATRQSTTYEARLFKYAQRGFAVAAPGPGLGPIIRAAVAEVERAGFERRVARVQGPGALAAMLHATYGSSGNDARWSSLTYQPQRMLLGGRICDYAGVETRYISHLILVRDQKKEAAFVGGPCLQRVLDTNVCEDKNGTQMCTSLLPPGVTFRERDPHVQDRVDVLYTGSFHPTISSW